MKIAAFSDAHANLPALQAALQAIEREGVEAIYHTGDAIAIGPHPAECLDLLLHTPRLHPIMGNHDMWFAHGLPQPQPAWMSDGEVEHQHWTHAQLDPTLKAVVARWPRVVRQEWEGVRVTLMHYPPADSASGMVPTLRDPDATDLDQLFFSYPSDIVFYGHTHRAQDCQGQAHYVNLGSLGCAPTAVARFAILTCQGGHCKLEHHAVPYDDRPLLEAFETRQVPERAFIYRAFLGARFP